MESVIARNRFGLGMRPEERRLNAPRRWLADQIFTFDPSPPALQAAPSRDAVVHELVDLRTEILNLRRQRRMEAKQTAAARPALETNFAEAVQEARRASRQIGRSRYWEMVDARIEMAITSPAPFAERLVHFWANHFAVSVRGIELLRLAGLLEFEAVRPHVMGRFRDMLFAVTRHPGMLLYLNQARSIGPNSRLSQRIARRRSRQFGLNENLARELMELHTLGVDGGYSQRDVTELAQALTGWTVAGLVQPVLQRTFPDSTTPGAFHFADALHEPGQRVLMGRTYAQAGAGQAEAMLEDLAAHPSTGRHLATKLARHFAGDAPPAALVERLAQTYRQSDGDLPSLYRVLINARECWVEAPLKFKTPWEWTISIFRALGASGTRRVAGRFSHQLGHRVWTPGSPAGFDDIAASWTGSAALTTRVEIAQRIADNSRDRVDARTLAPQLFGDMLSGRTVRIIAGAETASQGLALLLVSPEFMRR